MIPRKRYVDLLPVCKPARNGEELAMQLQVLIQEALLPDKDSRWHGKQTWLQALEEVKDVLTTHKGPA